MKNPQRDPKERIMNVRDPRQRVLMDPNDTKREALYRAPLLSWM